MYLTLLDATEKAIEALVSAQRTAEEIYIDTVDKKEKKNLNIKKKNNPRR